MDLVQPWTSMIWKRNLISILLQTHSSTNDFDFFSVSASSEIPPKMLSCEDGIYMRLPDTSDTTIPLCQLPRHHCTHYHHANHLHHLFTCFCRPVPLSSQASTSSKSLVASPQACCWHYSCAGLTPFSHVNDVMHNVRDYLPIKPGPHTHGSRILLL